MVMQPSGDSGNVANGIQSDRSITPLLPDLIDQTVYYLPNGYPSTAYYYSGMVVWQFVKFIGSILFEFDLFVSICCVVH